MYGHIGHDLVYFVPSHPFLPPHIRSNSQGSAPQSILTSLLAKFLRLEIHLPISASTCQATPLSTMAKSISKPSSASRQNRNKYCISMLVERTPALFLKRSDLIITTKHSTHQRNPHPYPQNLDVKLLPPNAGLATPAFFLAPKTSFSFSLSPIL